MQVNNNNNVSFGAIRPFPELHISLEVARTRISELVERFQPVRPGGILFFRNAKEQDAFSRELGNIPHVKTDYYEDEERGKFHIWTILNALTMHFKK